jgi:hypothetical protein
VLDKGHWRLRTGDVVPHAGGVAGEGFVVSCCALCTSFTKVADKTDVSPEFDVLLAMEFCSVRTEIMATAIAPATRGMTVTTISSSMSVNPPSWARRDAQCRLSHVHTDECWFDSRVELTRAPW